MKFIKAHAINAHFPFHVYLLLPLLLLLTADKFPFSARHRRRAIYDNVRHCFGHCRRRRRRHCTRYCGASCTFKHLNRAALRFKCFLVVDVVDVVAISVAVAVVRVVSFFVYFHVFFLLFIFHLLSSVIVRCEMPFATWISILLIHMSHELSV